MPDALNAIPATGAAGPIAGWQADTESMRPVAAKELDAPDPATAQEGIEIEELLNELSVQVALTTFVMARDEIRRQGEQITARIKEAQEEPE